LLQVRHYGDKLREDGANRGKTLRSETTAEASLSGVVCLRLLKLVR
jgi:hypothetical protein